MDDRIIIKNKYRHEYKYLISHSQGIFIENEIRNIMNIDKNTLNNVYSVRSLYFDDFNNSCFYDNENGVDPREKYRIRIYNGSTDRINLECKRKQNGKTLKISSLLTIEQCRNLMDGKIVKDYQKQNKLIQKLCFLILTRKYQPKIIVEYERKPYVYKEGNVRVTFDANISSSNYVSKFLEKDIPKRAILPIGMSLLEVKYDDFLPDIIYNELEIDSLNQTTFSKYYYSRCYDLSNNI